MSHSGYTFQLQESQTERNHNGCNYLSLKGSSCEINLQQRVAALSLTILFVILELNDSPILNTVIQVNSSLLSQHLNTYNKSTETKYNSRKLVLGYHEYLNIPKDFEITFN